MKVRSIYFCQHVIFNKVVTYKLEACDHVRKCFTKISRRKFIDNLKRATAQDQWRIISVMESFLMKLLGWTLDLHLQWKKASTCGNCRLITLIKETPSWKFPWEFPKLLQSVISPFVVKKQIIWKITWKVGVKLRKRDDSSVFCTEYSFISSIS